MGVVRRRERDSVLTGEDTLGRPPHAMTVDAICPSGRAGATPCDEGMTAGVLQELDITRKNPFILARRRSPNA